MSDGSLIIDTSIDNSGVQKGLDGITTAVDKGASKIKKAFAAIGITKLAKDAIGLASDLEEVQNVVDVAFGSSADTINKFAKDAATSFGLSELSAKQFSGTMGAMLKSMGLTGDAVVNMSMDIVGLTGDMASFYNLDHQETFDKIRAGISGETEPLKQLGINMSVANLEAYALQNGMLKVADGSQEASRAAAELSIKQQELTQKISKYGEDSLEVEKARLAVSKAEEKVQKSTQGAWNELDQATQATIRYNYLMSVTADAQGDFTRTQDSFANQLRIAKLEVETAGAAIGKELLPVATQGAKVVGNLAKTVLPGVAKALKWVLDNSKTLLPIAAGLLTTYKSYKIFNDITKYLNGFVTKMSFKAAAMLADGTATAAATAANATFTAAMAGETVALNAGTLAAGAQTAAVSALAAAKAALLNPLGLAVVGIGALTAATIALVSQKDPEIQAIHETRDAIRSEMEARQELIDQQDEYIQSGMGEILMAEELYGQLLSLADANGTISAADAQRASFLAEQLAPILGETIQLNKDGTASLLQGKDAIYASLEAKKAQLYLEALEPAYKEALVGKIEALNRQKDLGMQMDAAQAEIDKAKLDMDAALAAGDQKAAEQAAMRIEEQKRLLNELGPAYDEARQMTAKHYEDISMYEQASLLASEGNVEGIEELLNRKANAYSSNTDNIRDIKHQEYEDAEAAYQEMLKMVESGEAQISQKELDAAKKRRDDAKVEWEALGTDSVSAYERGFFAGQGGVKEAAQSVVESAQTSAASVDFYSTGLNGVTGLKNGWLAGIPSLKSAALQAANTVWSTIKSKWGIASPAKEFAKLARFGGDGLVVGFEEKIPEAEGAMEDVLDAMMDKARQVVAWRSGSVASNILAPITNYATAGAPTNLSATIQNNHTTQLTLDGRAIAESNNRQNQMLKLQYGMR